MSTFFFFFLFSCDNDPDGVVSYSDRIVSPSMQVSRTLVGRSGLHSWCGLLCVPVSEFTRVEVSPRSDSREGSPKVHDTVHIIKIKSKEKKCKVSKIKDLTSYRPFDSVCLD